MDPTMSPREELWTIRLRLLVKICNAISALGIATIVLLILIFGLPSLSTWLNSAAALNAASAEKINVEADYARFLLSQGKEHPELITGSAQPKIAHKEK